MGVDGFWSSFVDFGFAEAFKVLECSDGMFAVELQGGAEFIEDEGFLFSGGLFISIDDGFNVFFF